MRILVCDDDTATCELLRAGFTREGHAVDVVHTGAEAVWLAGEVDFDAILLDGVLPDLDGFDVCRRLRDNGVHAPVLMITARDDVDHRVTGLDSGADDYLAKPFHVREVLARLRALHRRSSPARSPVLRFADLELDPSERRVTRAGVRIDLTAKEFELLHRLMRADGAVVTRRQIVDALWDFATETERNTVDVHVRNLRAKVDRPFPTALIRTVRGTGYRIFADD